MDTVGLFNLLLPYIKEYLRGQSESEGGQVAPGVHGLNSVYHSGTLGDGQAPQFALLNGTRQFTGSISLLPGLLVDGVDISEHAANPSAHHTAFVGLLDDAEATALPNASDLIKIAGGAGLNATASGSTLTLAVGAGTLISVSADSVSLANGSTQYQVPLTGANPFTPAWHTTRSDGATYPNSVLRSDGSGDLTLHKLTLTDRLRTSLIDSAAGTGLTVQPALDLLLDPQSNKVKVKADGAGPTGKVDLESNNFASQTTGWRIGYNGAADFRYLYVDEMHAKAFIADIEQALAGGQIIAKSVAKVASQFKVPAAGASTNGTTYPHLVVESFAGFPSARVFVNGDTIMLRQFSRSDGSLSITNCFGTVTWLSTDTTAKTQTYQFTRLSGTVNGHPAAGYAATDSYIEEGTLAIDFGTSGNGYYEVNAIDGAWGLNSPYAQTVTWTLHPWYDRYVRARFGNLAGMAFGQAGEFGLYAGDGTGDSSRFIRVSNNAGLETHNLPIKLYDGSSVAVQLDVSSGNPFLAIGNPIPTGYLGQTGLWAGKDGAAYKLHLGSVSGGALVKGLSWDGSSLQVRGDLVVGPGIGPILDGALLYCAYDGPLPYATDYQVDTTGHRGQVATPSAAPVGRPGKFGKALALGRATTNLLRNPSLETNTTYYTFSGDGTGPTRERSTAAAYVGSYGLRWVLGTSPSSIAYCYQNTGQAPSQGASYTGSIWVKAVGSTIGKSIRLGLQEAGGAQPNAQTWAYFTASADWQRVTVTRTIAEADRTDLRLFVYYDGTGAAGDELHADAWQVNLLGYAVPYFDGSFPGCSWSGTAHGSTSSWSAHYLTYPIAGNIRAERGTVMAWVRVDGYSPIAGYLFQAGAANTDLDAYLNSVGAFTGRVNNVTRTTAALSLGDWHHLAMVWDCYSDRLQVYLDGVASGTSDPGDPPLLHSSDLKVGWGVSDNYVWPGYICHFAILDHALSSDEVRAMYLSTKPPVAVSNPFELMLTGQGKGRVIGHADGLFGYDASGNEAFALAAGSPPWGSRYSGGLGSGDLVLGDPDAMHLLYDASEGKMQWKDNSGNVQAYVDTDGAITAGGGAIRLKASGIWFTVPNTTTPDGGGAFDSEYVLNFRPSGWSTNAAEIKGYYYHETIPASAGIVIEAFQHKPNGTTYYPYVAIKASNTYVSVKDDSSTQACRMVVNDTIRIQANQTGLGFFAATPVAKPTVSGSKGGNAALASLLTALANLGLVTDSTT